jgi:hypothetical protein
MVGAIEERLSIGVARHPECAVGPGSSSTRLANLNAPPQAPDGVETAAMAGARCRNNVEGRLAMKLRWIDSNGVSNHDLAELPALRQRTDGFLWLDIPE